MVRILTRHQNRAAGLQDVGADAQAHKTPYITLILILTSVAAPELAAQTNAFRVDSLQLRHMRIRAQSTNACKVLVSTSSSMNIETDISPANVRRWIDTATAYAAARPDSAKGQSIRYAWITLRLGVERTITDRLDAYEFVIGGHGIPIAAREIPRIAKLLESAATQTLEQSAVPGGCPGRDGQLRTTGRRAAGKSRANPGRLAPSLCSSDACCGRNQPVI